MIIIDEDVDREMSELISGEREGIDEFIIDSGERLIIGEDDSGVATSLNWEHAGLKSVWVNVFDQGGVHSSTGGVLIGFAAICLTFARETEPSPMPSPSSDSTA